MATAPYEVSWNPPRQACADWSVRDDIVVWVSVAKLDEAWKRDHGFYIGPCGSGAAIEDRYARVGAWLAAKQDGVDLPVVAIDGDMVAFSDGRHRFAWLRDHGVRAMPVQVPADQVAEFERKFGVGERASIIHVR